jgi:hypothetical protein
MGMFNFISRDDHSPREEKWSVISTAISQMFEEIREELYSTSTEILQRVFYDGKSLCGCVYNDHKQGIKIKAFQLYLTSYVIAKNRWIKQSVGKNFADLLWAQVLGTQLVEGIEQAKCFSPEIAEFPRIYKFFCLLAEDITGKVNPAEGFLLTDKLGSIFVGDCVRALSNAFEKPNATEIVNREAENARQIINEISKRFFNEIENLKENNGLTSN